MTRILLLGYCLLLRGGDGRDWIFFYNCVAKKTETEGFKLSRLIMRTVTSIANNFMASSPIDPNHDETL